MIDGEAQAVLAVGPGPATTDHIRDAYLRRVQNVRLDVDPHDFMRLRAAFELLTHGAGASVEEIAAARDSLAAQPDSEDARWRLLSCLPYGSGPEASSVLRDGAERQPEAFLDELMFHFPERVPGELLRRAGHGASIARLLLIADVHATEGQSAEALEVLRSALAGEGAISSPALLRLAARPIFSLQAHAQTKPATEALALVQANMGAHALDAETGDLTTATMLRVAIELGQLDDTFPLDLRQVAARAAKHGDFQNTPYEARFAARLMKPLEVSALNAHLTHAAPTLAGILGLSLTDDQLRPKATPNVLIPFSWGGFLIFFAFIGIGAIGDRNAHRRRDGSLHELATGVTTDTASYVKNQIQDDCADPGSDQCRRWAVYPADVTEEPDAKGVAPEPYGLGSSASSADGGIGLGSLGIIGNGKPDGAAVRRRHHPRDRRQ